ncbi:pilus assembly protein [Iamia majanohamensis]|uniref:Pilus assembly protein n=1 Tax=Iamia majanohamensis TaxID=467976 RepID=A0AAF0BXD1_9ACTN|nr:TadE family protein [Iamia majanohamensis]WCO68873.1 pilus assembly protein [Iamia majanohamensis]
MELAFVGLLLVMVVFATLDYGRVAQLQNRMSNAAREGAAIARETPAAVDSGCQGRENVADRSAGQDIELSQRDGYTVTVALADGDVRQEYTGCGTPTGGVAVGPGDRVVVTVTADIDMLSPFAAAVTGDTLTLSREVETVVQG